ncbi:MAG TPA: enoyl-CoA hydratase-related protein [Rhodocyclaceae bacterium]|nr:enoyl-CoA hydratase-related protein [Rhodocyclaceae bacterium]
MSGQILQERAGDVVTLRISNPEKLNALDHAMWLALGDTLRTLAADDSLRCLIVRGDGDKAFAAGGDVEEFLQLRMDVDSAWAYHEGAVAPALDALADFPTPVVAMIQGPCIGGGLEIACCCDIRIAGEDASFGAPINRLGFNMYAGELVRVAAVAGIAETADILLSAKVLNASEALSKGLVHRVLPTAELPLDVEATVRRITNGAPLVAREHKRWLKRLRNPQALTQEEKRSSLALVDSADYREGLNAFLGKRKPEFRGH